MRRLGLLLAMLLACPSSAWPQGFTYNPPGELVAGSGTGREDDTIYVPGIRFPIENAPAYANSQVWGNGGMYGPGGSQCDEVNYSYPWWDNYCETRSWDMPLCPTGEGHQGQDIRPSTCADDVHWAVAAEDGTVTNIGTYSLYLEGESGTLHRYLHMEPSSIPVSVGNEVTRGQRLGRVSNAFGGTPTTIHLHYDINQYLAEYGNVYVPPYMSLVVSYQELPNIEPAPCEALPAQGGVIDEGDPCFALHGPMAYWRHVTTAGYGGNLYWTYAWEGALSNWAEWRIHLERGGEYLVEVYIDSSYGQSQEAIYLVRHDGVEEDFRFDQSTASGWAALGTFQFAQGADQFVAVHDNTGELVEWQRQLVADALRITPLDLPEEIPDELADLGPGDPAPDAGDDPVADILPPDLPEDTGGPDQEQDLDGVLSEPEQNPQPDADRFAVSQGAEGCGCTTGPGTGPKAAIGLALLALLVLKRRSLE